MPWPGDEPVWLNGRMLAHLVEACRRDHRSPLADVPPRIRDRLLAASRQEYRSGETDPGRLGAEYFAQILGEPGFGPGRPLLALVATLVFWALNGHEVAGPPGSLVGLVRRVTRTGQERAKVAAWFRERGRQCVR